VFRCRLAQLVFCPAWNARFNGLFQVSVETFIRVQFRRVTGQVEGFDLLDVRCQPLFDRLAMMHAQVIKNQEDLAPSLLDKCLEKLDKSQVIEVPIDNHPTGFSLISHG